MGDARFLLRDPSTKLWHEIGQPKAVEKTSQALREGLSKMRKKPVNKKKKITILNDEKDTIDSIKKEGSLLKKYLAKAKGNDKSRNEGSSPNDEPVESDVLLKKYKKFIFSMEHSLTGPSSEKIQEEAEMGVGGAALATATAPAVAEAPPKKKRKVRRRKKKVVTPPTTPELKDDGDRDVVPDFKDSMEKT